MGNVFKIMMSKDGITWTPVDDGIYSFGVAWGSNKFVAGGNNGKIAYWNGN